MANTKLPLSVVKHFSTGIASSGKHYINLFIYYYLFITMFPVLLPHLLLLFAVKQDWSLMF